MDRAGAAGALIATDFGACQVEALPQRIEQGRARVNAKLIMTSVHTESY